MGNAIGGLLFQPPSPTYRSSPNYFWLYTKRQEKIGTLVRNKQTKQDKTLKKKKKQNKTKQNKIGAFFIDRAAKTTLLFSHGNAEDLGVYICIMYIIYIYMYISVHVSFS